VISSWFFLSALNYDARSTTHQSDSGCCDAERNDSWLRQLCQHTEKNEEAFPVRSAWQEPSRNVASARLVKASHQRQDSGSHHTVRWTMLPHPPHSPDLASSDFHLLAVCGRKFDSDDDVVSAVGTWLRQPGKKLYRLGTSPFHAGAKPQNCMERS